LPEYLAGAARRYAGGGRAGTQVGPGGPAGVVAVLDHRKDVHLRAIEQVSGEEVQRQDPLRLGAQELRPPRAIPARSRADPGVLEDLPHRRRRHGDAEPGKLTVDPPVPP